VEGLRMKAPVPLKKKRQLSPEEKPGLDVYIYSSLSTERN
jgi:hypothetical protein